MAGPLKEDLGTLPDYVSGISVQSLPEKVKGPGTVLITRTRPTGRIKVT
jgi:hypothetical protein